MRLSSPAKVNLFFRVLYQREDGFHEIASLMQAVSLCDVIEVNVGQKEGFTCSDPSLPTDETNLVCRACALFRQRTGFRAPVTIHLEKRIPIQGGLGGGSGNVATVLYALNALSGLEVDEHTLAAWGGEISSDTPFFFSGGTAYVTGRGEKVASLSPLLAAEVYLVKPVGEGLPTPLVYRRCRANVHSHPPSTLLRRAFLGDLVAVNDLEEAAFSLLPGLEGLKGYLMTLGFEKVVMTGSGTAFVCFGTPHHPITRAGTMFWKGTFLSRPLGEWYPEGRGQREEEGEEESLFK